MYKWSERSYENLRGVRVELVAVATLALNRLGATGGPDFAVTEGRRSEAEQERLVDEGSSTTYNSRHLTGHAIDIVAFDRNYNVTWESEPYKEIARAFKAAAGQLGVEIEWGGDWESFVDMPHFALDWNAYPIKENDDGAAGTAV